MAYLEKEYRFPGDTAAGGRWHEGVCLNKMPGRLDYGNLYCKSEEGNRCDNIFYKKAWFSLDKICRMMYG